MTQSEIETLEKASKKVREAINLLEPHKPKAYTLQLVVEYLEQAEDGLDITITNNA